MIDIDIDVDGDVDFDTNAIYILIDIDIDSETWIPSSIHIHQFKIRLEVTDVEIHDNPHDFPFENHDFQLSDDSGNHDGDVAMFPRHVTVFPTSFPNGSNHIQGGTNSAKDSRHLFGSDISSGHDVCSSRT